MSGVFLWGWDRAAADWVKVLVNPLGYLQTVVVASALPAGGATAAGQDISNDWLSRINVKLRGGLPATLDAGHLRVREQNWPLTYPLSAAQIALLQAVTVGNFPADYPLPAAQVATLQQVTEQGTPSVHLYGYDTANWQTLLVESDVLKNLRVKLYDGAEGIDSDELDSTIVPTGDRGILTRSQVCGYNLEPFHQRRTDSDALAAVTRELCQMNIALLYGYNGSTFDRIRIESSTAFNLRVKLYDGANAMVLDLLDEGISGNQRGLLVGSCLYGKGDGDFYAINSFTASWDTMATTWRTLLTSSNLLGFNGATWDRLRTWGVGVLKVGRAEIDSTTVRKTAAGAVVAGAHNLYWIACSPDSPSAEWELTDAIAGGGAVVYDHFDSDKHSEHLIFDPPMKFTTGIWIEKFDHMHSLVFCYV